MISENRSRFRREPNADLPCPDNGSAWLTGTSLLPAVGAPPKNPHDDDEENREDEEDDNGEDEEPAVIREPDEC
jgi:hypothetical protein